MRLVAPAGDSPVQLRAAMDGLFGLWCSAAASKTGSSETNTTRNYAAESTRAGRRETEGSLAAVEVPALAPWDTLGD
jgi:hypothetical protein